MDFIIARQKQMHCIFTYFSNFIFLYMHLPINIYKVIFLTQCSINLIRFIINSKQFKITI